MLPCKHRLPAYDIPSVRTLGRRIRTEYFDYYVRAGSARFSVIVGSHIDKRATVRNRMRRFVQEAIRLKGILPLADGVFVARKKFPKSYGYENIAPLVHSIL